MTSLLEIQDFLAPRKLAFAGASRNPKKFGTVVFSELKQKGFELFPVHPIAEEIQGIPCYKSIDDLPDTVEMLYVVTPKSATLPVIQDAVKRGFRRIWIQQSSDTPESLALAQENKIPVISGRCMLMFVEPVGSIHKVHRWFSRVFGAYPN
jgi:uncharacterized protein